MHRCGPIFARFAGPVLAAAALACTSPPASEDSDEAGPETGESGTRDGGSGSDTGAEDWADSLDESSDTGSDTGAEIPVGPEVVDYETCIADPGGPTADLVGDSPLGPFSGQYAWFGWLTCEGEAISPTLVIGESPQDLEDAIALAPSGGAIPLPSLEWFLLGNCNPENGWVGEGGGGVTLRSEGPWELGYGSFAITENYKLFEPVDPEDPPTMTGELSLVEDGFSLSGSFTAHYCGALSYALDGC